MNAQDHLPRTVKNERRTGVPMAEVLAGHPFLSGLRPEHLRVLANNAMPVSYEAGELIFRKGDPANRFYLIEEGRVSLELPAENSPPVAVQDIGAGNVLGWSWLFPPYCWHFGARALEPTRAIFLYGTRLRELCEEDHDFGYEIMKRVTQVVIDRLQATRRELRSVRA